MPRHLFIVAREVPGLYEVLAEQFAGEPDVEIILDRRHRQRRSLSAPPSDERRAGDRRVRVEVEEELRQRAHVILTLPG